MKRYPTSLICIGCLIAVATCVAAPPPEVEEAFRAQIAQIASIQKPVFEETKRARNERLNEVFREYVQKLGGGVTEEVVSRFNALVKEQGLTNFDDFLTAQTTPLRYVNDPISGDKVPVLGPLGSDVVNGWLAAMEVADGTPLSEQPMYNLAGNALTEHLDFAIIGIRDPKLSIELLPPEFRENARWAYKRLNPTNVFDGGFDHPLFYATIREATAKLFRDDYPKAKLTMADVVVSEEKGGFGIRSCLLCHDRSYNDVYKRLVAQGRLLKAKAEELREVAKASLDSSVPAELPEDPEEVKKAEKEAKVFLLAAQRVLETFPDEIDEQAVEKALVTVSNDDISRLLPGYEEFRATLERTGCLECHGGGSDPPAAKNPAKYDALVLDPSPYYKSRNVAALLKVVNIDDLNESKLLHKAGGKVNHRGKDDVQLDEEGVAELAKALRKWIHPFEEKQ